MSHMILAVALTFIVAGCVELATTSHSLDYEEVRGDPYPCQMTVTQYPGWILRMCGVQSEKTVYVSRDWVYHSGWYEIPEMKEVSTISKLTPEFHRFIRQAKYIENKAT